MVTFYFFKHNFILFFKITKSLYMKVAFVLFHFIKSLVKIKLFKKLLYNKSKTVHYFILLQFTLFNKLLYSEGYILVLFILVKVTFNFILVQFILLYKLLLMVAFILFYFQLN